MAASNLNEFLCQLCGSVLLPVFITVREWSAPWGRPLLPQYCSTDSQGTPHGLPNYRRPHATARRAPAHQRLRKGSLPWKTTNVPGRGRIRYAGEVLPGTKKLHPSSVCHPRVHSLPEGLSCHTSKSSYWCCKCPCSGEHTRFCCSVIVMGTHAHHRCV